MSNKITYASREKLYVIAKLRFHVEIEATDISEI